MKAIVATLLLACCCGAYAQYGDGPVPARLQIPGAIALGPKAGNFRQGRVIRPAPDSAARVRRPGLVRAGAFEAASPSSPFPQRPEETAKPVTEEPEEDNPSTPEPYGISYGPTQLPRDLPPQFYPGPSPPPEPLVVPDAGPSLQLNRVRLSEPARVSQPVRPPPQSAPSAPARLEAPTKQQQPVRLAPLSYRPARPQFRPETRPPVDDEEEEQPVRQVYRQPASRPQQHQQHAQPQAQKHNSRERKPVAQVIRKYRDDNPDGSITWGFENDDGSFKEETIGTDCVTRGRYGYVDPDGLKRDYSYETGIPCDKAKEEREEQGFVDYQENKAILPNGIVLDLANMGKKSRRPQRQSQ